MRRSWSLVLARRRVRSDLAHRLTDRPDQVNRSAAFSPCGLSGPGSEVNGVPSMLSNHELSDGKAFAGRLPPALLGGWHA
jgi:hypothetical protein